MTDTNGIPSMGNFNPDSNHNTDDNPLNEERWDIPNLNGFDFDLTEEQTIANTQSLTQLSESTSTALRAINAQNALNSSNNAAQNNAAQSEQRASDTQDPEATASFDPLAEDAQMLPATESPAQQSEPSSDVHSTETVVLGSPAAATTPAARTSAPSETSNSTAGSTADSTSTPSETATLPLNSAEDRTDGASTYETSTADASPAETTLTSFADFAEDDDDSDDAPTRTYQPQDPVVAALSSTPQSHRGSHAKQLSDQETSERSTHRMLIWGIAAVLAIVVIVGLTIFFRNMANAQTHEQILAACTSSRQSAQKSSESLQKVVNDATATAATQSSDVEDTATLTKAKNALEQANASLASEKALDECKATMSDAQLRALTNQADTIVSNQTQYTLTINKTKTAVENSKATKTQSNAKNNLSTKRQEAQTLYDQSNGKVTDETTRTNLKKAIDDADSLIAQNIKNVTSSQYSSAIDTLNNTMTAVQNSMKAYEESEKAKEANVAGVCAPFAGTYSNGSSQVTLRGDCTLRYSDNSIGTPSTCTFSDGSTGSCATVDDEDNPNEVGWSVVCSGDGACQNSNARVSNRGGQITMELGGQSYTRQ